MVPIGAIIPWPGAQDTVPNGWILCNGAAIPYDRYPLLYDTIGNVYGGTTGSTFKLPDLLSQNAGIMDIFQGHFSWLQNAGDAHKPENSNINEDEFWLTVGKSDNGNSGNDVTQDHNTTVDVVGEQTSKPDVTAKYGEFTLSEGTADSIIQVLERKTTDVHLPSHGHSYDVSGDTSPSYNRKNKGATRCKSSWGSDGYCKLEGSCTNVNRSTNDPPKTGFDMTTVGASKTVSTTYRKGGGNIEWGSNSYNYSYYDHCYHKQGLHLLSEATLCFFFPGGASLRSRDQAPAPPLLSLLFFLQAAAHFGCFQCRCG